MPTLNYKFKHRQDRDLDIKFFHNKLQNHKGRANSALPLESQVLKKQVISYDVLRAGHEELHGGPAKAQNISMIDVLKQRIRKERKTKQNQEQSPSCLTNAGHLVTLMKHMDTKHQLSVPSVVLIETRTQESTISCFKTNN